MYLLILFSVKKEILIPEFTFHNVSINSVRKRLRKITNFYLHSIMYLLIRTRLKRQIILLTNLHSIMYLLIRRKGRNTSKSLLDLHSIMYLLILPTVRKSALYFFLFTFHNVSINSGAIDIKFYVPKIFTFHNVSINSKY